MTRQEILFRCLILIEFEELGEHITFEETIVDTMEYLGFTTHGRNTVSDTQVRKIFPMLLEWDYRIRDIKFKKCVLKSMYWRCGAKKEYIGKIPKQLEKFKYKPIKKGEEDFI